MTLLERQVSARALDMGRVALGAVKLITRHWAILLPASLLLVGAPGLLLGWVGAQVAPVSDEAIFSITRILYDLVADLLLGVPLGIVTACAAVAVVADANGERTSPGQIYRQIIAILPRLLLVSAAFSGMVVLSGFLIFLFGAAVAAILAAMIPIAATEGLGLRAAMSRARLLSRRQRWRMVRLFCLTAVALFIVSVLFTILTERVAVAVSDDPGASLSVQLISEALFRTCAAVVISAGLAATYAELTHVRHGTLKADVSDVFA